MERRTDTLLRVDTAEGAFLLLVEAQRQDKEEKISAWAYYLAHVYAKYDVPPVLLVITQATKTAAWARGPLCIGPPQWTSLSVHPVVFGPDNIPAVTDYEAAAKDIPLATLSAITHAEQADIDDIIEALATAVKTTESMDPALFIELTTRGLGDSRAGNVWRQLMTVDTSFFQSQIFQDVRAAGEAKGEAKAILRILDNRKIPVPEDIRSRIATCTDLDQLTSWLDRAIDAKTIDDLFE